MSVDEATLVRLKNVSKVYQTGTVALQNMNLTIREGEFISFVGPSGCGKSTAFRMIAGLAEPSQGRLEVLGLSPKDARKKGTGVSFVFQDATLLPWRSVWDNVILPLELRGVPKISQRDEAFRVLNLVGLVDHVKALPRQLSGGMRMRVSIARALISRPKLLLMDEPFGALDEITRQNLQDELLKIWQHEKMTILFVTHNVFEAVYLSTRIVVMTPRPGRISTVLDVPVPFPRDESFRSSPEFGTLVAKVSTSLKH